MTTQEVLAIFASGPDSLPTFEEWLNKMGGVDGFLYQYNDNIYERYDYLLSEAPDGVNEEVWLREQVTDSLRERYEKWMSKYYSLQFPLTLFRCVTLNSDPNKIPEFPNTGIYWTDDESSAQCHWGDFGSGMVEYTLAIEVNSDDIDWERTLEQNMNVAVGDDEQEITLKKNRRVHLIGIKPAGESWEKVSYWVKT
jgi:hypothetical protein